MKRLVVLVFLCFLHSIRAYADGLSVLITQSPYNARCDCTPNGPTASCHDDTDNINQALLAVHNAGGGEVIIPPGTCIISPSGTTRFLNLYDNITIRGAGRKSVLKIADHPINVDLPGDYAAIFQPANCPNNCPTTLTNVAFRDFKVDQNAAGNANVNIPAGGVQQVIYSGKNSTGPLVSAKGITVSGMFFDPTDGTSAIWLFNGATFDLASTVTNSYFSFQRGRSLAVDPYYDVSTVLLEGSQQIITNNTFTTALADRPVAAIETLGGRNVIANNVFRNYITAVDLLPSYYACDYSYTQCSPPDYHPIDPSETVIANNSVTCTLAGITIWSTSFLTFRNVAITGNTIDVCNATRALTGSQAISGIQTVRFAHTAPGVQFENLRGYEGDVDGLTIANNVITMEHEDRVYHNPQDPNPDNGPYVGGIVLWQVGNLSNVLVKGNIIKNAPVSGIRVGAADADDPTHSTVQRLRIVDNIIVDAGNNPSARSIYRHGIGVFDRVMDADIARNMMYDTQTGTSTWGKYSLYLSPAPPTPPATANVRASQNTVRVSAGQGQLLWSQVSGGVKDATNANEVLISSIQGSTETLPVDFMSFTQYTTTIANTTGLLTVQSPSSAPGTQWTVGQVVTFRFLCQTAGGCSVGFAAPYSTTGNLAIDNGKGRAITFQVENGSGGGVRKFFELYRSVVGV